MLWEWLGDIPCGSVRFWACADMSLIAGEPPSPLGSKQEVFGYASIRWAEFPLIEQAIQEILRGLARRALALWPHWYDARSDALALEERGEIEPFASERIAARIRQTRQDISKPWLQDAIKACRAGHPPLLPKYPQALQAAQLALSLKADRLHLLMIVESPQQPEGRLLGLVRVSEWLARHTDAAVAVIIPETLASHPENRVHERRMAATPRSSLRGWCEAGRRQNSPAALGGGAASFQPGRKAPCGNASPGR